MYALPLWSVHHAGGVNTAYRGFEYLLIRLQVVFRAIGYDRVGARLNFIQTQYCFERGLLRSFMAEVTCLGLLDQGYFLAGVGPLRSAKAAAGGAPCGRREGGRCPRSA